MFYVINELYWTQHVVNRTSKEQGNSKNHKLWEFPYKNLQNKRS
jgi:hypothetical protein